MSEPREYGEPTGDPELGFESAADIEAISDHIERYWGEVDEVLHEIVSEYVHIDVHVVRATPDRPYHILVTSGMSDRPMTFPEGAEGCAYAELVMALPKEWPTDYDSFSDECNYWPVRLLKELARFPHVHRTWLWLGHTLSNDDPPQKYAPDVGFCAAALFVPVLCEEDAWSLEISPEKCIRFMSVIPIYEEELIFARKNGSDALFDRLDDIEYTEIVVKNRTNVCESM